jgi:hypothetical protein
LSSPGELDDLVEVISALPFLANGLFDEDKDGVDAGAGGIHVPSVGR